MGGRVYSNFRTFSASPRPHGKKTGTVRRFAIVAVVVVAALVFFAFFFFLALISLVCCSFPFLDLASASSGLFFALCTFLLSCV